MTQKTQVVLVDDVDGSEATQTISFAYQGVKYEIDLNDDHAAAIEESFNDWIQAARKVTGRSASTKNASIPRSTSRPGTSSRDLNAVRSWLRENGYEVSDRGRIAQMMLDAYDAAH